MTDKLQNSIATHSLKHMQATVKQSPVRAFINHAPSDLISSFTVAQDQILWASPRNAADIKKVKALMEVADCDQLPPYLPDLEAPEAKQLLVPIDWKNDHYVSVTPLTSLGLMDTLNKRMYQRDSPRIASTIQPNPMAFANHGELLQKTKGKVWTMRRGMSKPEQGQWIGDFYQITVSVESMNITSGFMSKGLPAIAGIGGMVHVLERETGKSLNFAVGIQSIEWIEGVKKTATINPNQKKTGGLSLGFDTSERTANAKLVILIKGDVTLREIEEAAKKLTRICGGSTWDMQVFEVAGKPAPASYLIDASKDIARLQNEGMDALDAALSMYERDGQYIEHDDKRSWLQGKNGYTLLCNGYSFLEEPKERKRSRNGYLHAWAEPTFSLITQGAMGDLAWWGREESKGGVFWRHLPNTNI